MSEFILKKSQLKRLVETGSNSAAMDLDIYVQPVYHDTSNGNENIEDTIENIVDRLNELKYMFKTGKKIPSELRSQFFEISDKLNSLYISSTEK